MSVATKIYKAFESEPAKAEAILEALDAYMERREAVTKAQFEKETWEIRSDIEKVRAEIEKVRAEVEKVRADVQIQIEKVRADLSTGIEKVRADLHQAINRQVIWIIVAISVMIGILKGLDILLK